MFHFVKHPTNWNIFFQPCLKAYGSVCMDVCLQLQLLHVLQFVGCMLVHSSHLAYSRLAIGSRSKSLVPSRGLDDMNVPLESQANPNLGPGFDGWIVFFC